ncbi:MAG: AmmeMemoRadiSam system protein A [Deltaproteobacteria bacterium]|nr:MAG: AmmeMemoRadiSam system protein A [Deltaproteobacteria bacterium]
MAGTLTTEQRKRLLEIARNTIAEQLERGSYTPQGSDDEALNRPCGAFVTLHIDGQLRGCIGTFTSSRPLVQTVQEMAVSAAFRDPRFPPLTREELDRVDLEISVLSPLRPVDDPEEIEVGRHGIYITRGFYSGVLLPQVATEYGWDRETFLDHTCLKAGLPPGCWRDPDTRIEVFEAEVFGEKDIEGNAPAGCS